MLAGGKRWNWRMVGLALLGCGGAGLFGQSTATTIAMPRYSVTVEAGEPPQLRVEHDHETVFELPVIAGLATTTAEEKLSEIAYAVHKEGETGYSLTATAKSSLWTKREFRWRFFPDHIEFQQLASGSGKLGRCYFLSDGVSNRWDNGTTAGHRWALTIAADRYFSPSPNHANQSTFSIAMPQTLGFSIGGREGSEEDFRPERMTGLFAPPPLFLAFHMGGGAESESWTSVGIGATPGEYQFPALEYSGSRYAGASFYIDYMGYKSIGGAGTGDFASPTLAIHFAEDPLGALERYTAWLSSKGFATALAAGDVRWRHLPIFCGWAEQTVESVPFGVAPNTLSTQAKYEKWIGETERRGLPVGTIVIDDKWQKGYGSFDVDEQKWPDLKGFVTAQHSRGRHVVLWVPVAHTDGLPDALCVHFQGKCVVADVGQPAYEAYLRPRIEHLVREIGVDGFKEDWVNAPAAPGLPLSGNASGIEFVRRFQAILYSEAHRWKPDALIETQTTNALFRDSSDVIRLNDVWYASRDVVEMMRLRARIATITGWPLVDTDNASSTTLKEWWAYMMAQPTLGIPALYFVTRTETTQETPSDAEWSYLAAVWTRYVQSLDSRSGDSAAKTR